MCAMPRIIDPANDIFELDSDDGERYITPTFVAAGRVHAAEPWGYMEHRHTSFEFHYIIHGSMRYWCNGTEMVAHEGDCYFLQPLQTHAEAAETEGIELVYVRFKHCQPSGKPNFIVADDSSPELQIIRGVDPSISNLLLDVVEEAAHERPGAKQVTEALILQLIWRIKRALDLYCSPQSDQPDRKRACVEEAIHFIHDHLDEPIKVSDVADHCCISSDYLSHIFKEITYSSPSKYIQRVKMHEAAKLILSENLNISEIAASFGFGDPLYFSKRFKMVFKKSPSEYRLATSHTNRARSPFDLIREHSAETSM